MKFNRSKFKAKTKNWRWWAILPFVLLVAIPLLPLYVLLEKTGMYYGTPKWMRVIFDWQERGDNK